MAALPVEVSAPTIERRFQLLALDLTIATNCPLLDRQLDYLVPAARHDFEPTTSARLEAVRQDSGYLISEHGAEPRSEGDPVTALSHLYRRAYALAQAALPRTGFFLHAACGRFAGHRFLLMGESGVGKSTLITRLLSEGVEAEGDELVLFADGTVCALPRRFHLKSGGLHHFPWLGEGMDRLPAYGNGDGTSVYALDPSEWGFPWEIRRGRLDAIILLEPNHGGQSRIEEIPRYRMIQKATLQLRLIDRSDRGCIAILCRHIDRAHCARLTLGNLDSAVEVLLSRLTDLQGRA